MLDALLNQMIIINCCQLYHGLAIFYCL